MKKKRDTIFTLMTIGMLLAFLGDIFFDYDSTTFFLSIIMLFCWDIATTLKRLYNKTFGDDE